MTKAQIDSLLGAISTISHGGISGPTGFEALTMAIGGEGMPGENNVASSLSGIAQSIENIASAIVYLADTLESLSIEKAKKES